MTTQAAKIARAEARVERRLDAMRAAWPNHPVYWPLVNRYRRAARIADLRRNQAGIGQ